MRKWFTLSIFLILGLTRLDAQDFPLQFQDEQGNVIADGTILTLNTPLIEEDDFGGGLLIPSGLYVKNTSSSEVICGSEYSITSISNGVIQTCFPSNCIQRSQRGSWSSETGTMAAGESKSIQTEWIPVDAGQADMDYQLVKYKLNPVTKKYVVDGHGPKITMKFVYDPAMIHEIDHHAGAISRVDYFTLDGRRVILPAHGLYVVKTVYVNGAVKTTKQRF